MTERIETFKIITIGDSDVGKTSIIRRYLYNMFDSDNMATIGVNFSYKVITLKNKVNVKIKLIDTAGQEKFKSLAKSYYKNADAALFVFALNDLDSFNHINDWVKSFKENNGASIPIYLIGNKFDIENKTVEQTQIDEFLKEYNTFKYYPASAASGHNIEKVFSDLAEEINKNFKIGEQKAIKLEKQSPKKKGFNCALCNFNTDV